MIDSVETTIAPVLRGRIGANRTGDARNYRHAVRPPQRRRQAPPRAASYS
jgi:hypothetical protein